MRLRSLCIFILVCLSLSCWSSELLPAQSSAKENPAGEEVLIKQVKIPFKGDLDQMRQRQMVRVLVNYSKTRFFYDLGKPYGFEYELLKAFEKFLNQGIKRKDWTRVIFIPVPFDQLVIALKEGQGDLAAAGLTITPEREEMVAFTKPYIPNVQELVVLHKDVKDIYSIEDLAGRSVYVRQASSYVSHLKQLNNKLLVRKIDPIDIVEAQQYIVTEDILDMVNAGIIPITVADHHLAMAWKQIMPNIVIRDDIAINSGGKIAWAVRKENSQLRAHLNAFLHKNKKGTLLGNILYKRYYLKAKGVKNPISKQERQKLTKVIDLFKKYAHRYEFDFLAIIAQAYQESGLDHRKVSPAGAVGIMQVKPSTAADKRINIKDIYAIENNIHAGVKYLHFLRNWYYNKPEISPADQVYFSWAAYNAGPAKINKIRRMASKKGFDPNQWFFNVEKVAAQVIGRESVEYVSNINKYYVAYQLLFNMNFKRQETVESLRKNIAPYNTIQK